MKSNVLVIGSGAREHVISEVVSKSYQVNMVYTLPGNSGMISVTVTAISVWWIHKLDW